MSTETTKRPSPYRAWQKLVAEFPELRWDLEQKLDYFVGWRIARREYVERVNAQS